MTDEEHAFGPDDDLVEVARFSFVAAEPAAAQLRGASIRATDLFAD